MVALPLLICLFGAGVAWRSVTALIEDERAERIAAQAMETLERKHADELAATEHTVERGQLDRIAASIQHIESNLFPVTAGGNIHK